MWSKFLCDRVVVVCERWRKRTYNTVASRHAGRERAHRLRATFARPSATGSILRLQTSAFTFSHKFKASSVDAGHATLGRLTDKKVPNSLISLLAACAFLQPLCSPTDLVVLILLALALALSYSYSLLLLLLLLPLPSTSPSPCRTNRTPLRNASDPTTAPKVKSPLPPSRRKSAMTTSTSYRRHLSSLLC